VEKIARACPLWPRELRVKSADRFRGGINPSSLTMKKPLLLSSLIVASAYSVAALANLAGYSAIDVFSGPAVATAALATLVLTVAFGDYRRRPRFRVPRSPQPASGLTGGSTSPLAAPDWTYTTTTRR
jgi:hypothetical protein